MPAGITERDGLFTVRQAAWHGLGVNLPEHPTRQQAQEIAHPWEPISEPVYRRIIVLDEGGPQERYEELEDFRLNARSDDGYPLGVVGDGFTLVKNQELYDIAEAIEGEARTGVVLYETGGSVYGGKKVWLLIRLRDPIVVSGDPRGETIAYYALQNSHDGGGSLRGQGTNVRIVCDNTSRAADLDASLKGTEFIFRHTSSVHERVEDAKEALAGWRHSIREWRLINEALVSARVSEDEITEFIERFVPMPPPHLISTRVENNVNEARGTLRTIMGGATCEGIYGTAYCLVQAAIEYHQHYRRAQSQASRFKRAYLDKSQITTDAVELAREVARL